MSEKLCITSFTVEVYVDTDKLSAHDWVMAKAADKDPALAPPWEDGICELEDHLHRSKELELGFFRGNSREAYTLEVKEVI